jgi:hypothetical protein
MSKHLPEQLRQFQNEMLGDPSLVVRVLSDGGAAVVAGVEALITKYVVPPRVAILPLALWATATHCFESFDCFPYLCLLSPTPRCGKTRLLEVLELLAARPWRGTAPTEAALFRYIEAKNPTLLLDEVEGLAKRNASERDSAVLAILNAGYKKGQTVPRCVGNSHELHNFRVYSPKAFAAIGRLPSMLADRSIIISMQRRTPGESVARFRFDRAKGEAEPIRFQVEQTVKALGAEIEEAYANLPELSFLSDRDEEIFSPLFAVCAVLAPERVRELERAAKALCDGKSNDALDDSLGLRLLADLMQLWPKGEESWQTADILSALNSEVESPWAGDCELNPRRLARMLRPFEILPRDVRTCSGSRKGYILAQVQLAHSRYIGSESATSATGRINTGRN